MLYALAEQELLVFKLVTVLFNFFANRIFSVKLFVIHYALPSRISKFVITLWLIRFIIGIKLTRLVIKQNQVRVINFFVFRPDPI